MPIHSFCGRTCVLSRRNESQTLRISTDPYRRGVYEWVVRFESTVDLQHELPYAVQSSIGDFVKWLRDNPNLRGDIERVPPDEDALLVTDRRIGTAEPSEFADKASKAVEDALDRMLIDFLRFPFRHRSENNLHCEVYADLCRVSELAELAAVASGEPVQLVHREWPEEYASKRRCAFRLNEIWPLGGPTESPIPEVGRGKYDLVVLSPQSVMSCRSVAQFADGEIPPIIAVEFGLNERFEHLRSDVAKLNSNGIPSGYVVHLLRPDSQPDNIEQTERLFELLARNNTVKGVYACVESRGGRRNYSYKRVNESAISKSTDLAELSTE